jgi:DNA repair exonuclease SbcCD ATPase subunit
MRFTSLHIEDFKSFEQADVSFAPGFTVVKGPNEAGKSSIQSAILVALFVDPKTSTEELEAVIRWGQDRRPRMHLEFVDNEVQYSLSKDFERGTTSLSWSARGDGMTGSTDDVEEAHRLIGSLLGSTSMDTYVNTACIRSEEVSKLPAAASPVSQRLQAKVTSGRQSNASEVLAAIETELASMASGGLRKVHETGPLRLSRERVEALLRSSRLMSEKLGTYQANTQTLSRLRQDLAAVERDVAEWSRKLELSDKAQTIEEDIVILEEHERDLKSAEVLRESVGHAAEELSNLDYDTLSGALERVQGLERHLHQQRLREAEINHQLAVLVLTQLQNVPAVSSTVIMISGVIVAIGFVLAGVIAHVAALYAGCLVGLALIAFALRSRRTVKIDNSRAYSDELAECVELIRQTQSELQRLLSAYSLHSVEELATVVREMRPAGDPRAGRQQRIERMLGDQRVENRQIELVRVSAEIATRQEALETLAPHRLSVKAYEHADNTLQSLSAKREAVQREMYRLEGELIANVVNSESLAAIDEELAAEQVRLARLERRRKGLERARSGVREALATTLSQVSGAFRTGVSRHLGPITGGRYTQVDAQIDEAGLHLLVFTSDKRKAVKADNLSRATQDQIYLAARMSLLDLVCDGRQPPLLLDDPFVNYDDARVANTVDLMRDLYRDYQIVLFTCVDRYDHFADSLITLSGPRKSSEPTSLTPEAASKVAAS